MVLQNDSITALQSQQSPTDPIDGTSPESTARRVNAQEVSSVPWSERTVVASRGSRWSMAISSAVVTNDALAAESIDQATTPRQCASSTTAQHSLLSVLGFWRSTWSPAVAMLGTRRNRGRPVCPAGPLCASAS